MLPAFVTLFNFSCVAYLYVRKRYSPYEPLSERKPGSFCCVAYAFGPSLAPLGMTSGRWYEHNILLIKRAVNQISFFDEKISQICNASPLSFRLKGEICRRHMKKTKKLKIPFA